MSTQDEQQQPEQTDRATSSPTDATDFVRIREFEGFKEAIVDAVHDSARGIHERLKGIETRAENDRRTTNDLLKIVGGLSSRQDNLDRTFKREYRHARKDDPPPDDDTPLTMRDLKRAAFIAKATLLIAAAGVLLFVSGLIDKLKGLKGD